MAQWDDKLVCLFVGCYFFLYFLFVLFESGCLIMLILGIICVENPETQWCPSPPDASYALIIVGTFGFVLPLVYYCMCRGK